MAVGIGGNSELTISDASYGVDTNGMRNYLETIRSEVINAAIQQIENGWSDVETEIRNGWVGVSCEAFLADFKIAREKMAAELAAEYLDLQARIGEIATNYRDQDNKLYDFDFIG